MNLSLQVGKEYRTRKGLKGRCICDDAKSMNGMYPCVVLIIMGDDERAYAFMKSGRYHHFGEENDLDLTAEWTKKPVFDPSVLAGWMKSLCLGPSGHWLGSNKVPKLFSDGSGWDIEDMEYVIIPDSLKPTYTGPWQESLVVFTEGVA